MVYRRLLVPISASADSRRAVEVACSLAAERGAELTVVFVIEVSPLLPLDARMDDDEVAARAAFREAEAIADAHGLRLCARKVRARAAGHAIVKVAEELGAQVVVIAAPRRRRARLGGTVRQVLAKASCPVIVTALPV